ncbi:MAG: universal stress protein [Cellvibrio sp.]|uniref:universal stress protein n=1 Tax=Cellvibrio sp. TaxID=1965322 RepID=UPI0027205645|nr:universal stress protein [Cellvibrio sp.]
MFKRILVAVDGSQTADQALKEAIKLAKELQAQLRIVHAVDIANMYLSVDFIDTSEISAAMIKSGQEILHKAKAVAKGAGIPVETRLIEINTLGHSIPEVIAEDAEAWPADLVVICTHGRRGLSHLFLGSVAEGVVRVATKPVLLVRGK